MKKILGLDLGTNSIGWAIVNEAEETGEESKIVKLGVRVNPLTTDEQRDFERGKPILTNAERTLKRGARRNLQRFKLRRENLISLLKEKGIINDETVLTEDGPGTTHQTLMLRAKSAREKVSLEEFARILLAINKKRGYKSNRKTQSEEEGQAIDGMAIAKKLYDENLTPGEYVYSKLKEGSKYIPDFYRSDLREEMNRIWKNQSTYYPEILTKELFDAIQDKNVGATWKTVEVPFNIKGIKQTGKREEQRLERYKWRALGLSEKLDLEELAIVLQEINGNINKSSGYLGAISDRSKHLYFNKVTVGEYLYNKIKKDPHTSLKNQPFYRQDYLDEFEQVWETQAEHYPQILTNELKTEARDVIIFYQRKLKSQKGLISFCQFENKKIEYTEESTGKKKTRTIGLKVVPKSSPLFQEFKIWQNLNNLQFVNEKKGEVIDLRKLDDANRKVVFDELNFRGNLKPNDVLRIISRFMYIGKVSDWKCNFEEIEGNRTNQSLFNVYQEIAEAEGYGFDWAKKSAAEIKEELNAIFPEIGIPTEILEFDANIEGDDFHKQPSYQLWHLIYSAEDDEKIDENDRLIYGNNSVTLRKQLHQKYGFKPEYAILLSNIKLQDDYGNLSSKAIRKIIPYLQAGHPYAKKDEFDNDIGACGLAGYNHSNSETAEDLKNKDLKDKLSILPKNSLRNPVVEKILNQMVNLVNQLIDEYGKPDEVRIELARELKLTAGEREKMQKDITAATNRNEDIRKLIQHEFGIPNPTKTDVYRYRLWEELKDRGYKTIFTDLYIPKEKLFSSEVDIEHIIPKALLYDDSYSNLTLAYKEENIRKANRTAFDFIEQDYHSNLDQYISNVELWYNNEKGSISKAKRNKLLMAMKDLPDGFIERDLKNTQYIARQARKMLQEVVRVVTPTTGRITSELRSDWGLTNMMKELNMPKYKALGLTEYEERLDIGSGKMKYVEVIKDWTKRNDHRHHAVDALVVAFTTHNHIQYLNYLNARRDTGHDKHHIINSIEKMITERLNGSRLFKEPIPGFRNLVRANLDDVLISYKTKNKVVTNNINKIKGKGKNYKKVLQTTPRGQLHKETVYGKILRPMDKPVKLNVRFPHEKVHYIIDQKEKQVIADRLERYEHKPEIAFASKTLKADPVLINGDEPLKEVSCFEEVYTIRKAISPDLKIDKVIDNRIRKILSERLSEYGDARKAFSNLDENPIWQNKEKGIAIKSVTITGVSNAISLNYKKDHHGKCIEKDGEKIETDFVSTGNNHHVAIYEDSDGNYQEQVVSFYEAVERANQGLPIVDKSYNDFLGWKFLFTMKQNEMFVFPSDDFNPSEIDLMDPDNYGIISKNLFRVQKIATRYYVFRHHLETTVTNNLDFTFKRIQTPNLLNGCIKVRINHIGQIVGVGEY